ncbi:citrate/2-methylcitrate synthase [Lacunimicrobium album]
MTQAETEAANQAVKGLKGVVAADTQICDVNGTTGQLVYRGYTIDDLAVNSNFEEVSYLLLKGSLPTSSQLAEFKKTVTAQFALPSEVIELIKAHAKDAHPMAMLRTAVSLLGVLDKTSEEHGVDDFYQQSLSLIAKISTITAAIRRARDGKDPIAPDASLSFAENVMYMLNGKKPTPDEAKSMDLILIVHAEHGLNASTFSGRVIAATLTDLYSSITGAIGALKGPLHGGANTAVLESLQEIGSVDKISGWIQNVKEKKGKFMGFGHAVYTTEDPRAKHLKSLSQKLGKEQGDTTLYDISVELEKQVTALIKKNCNVDFYSASLQHYMGIPGDMFTCIFAASRIVGWCAHVMEQIADNKIIRPQSHYVGPEDLKYVPISQRS